jgi:hypothetical protein
VNGRGVPPVLSVWRDTEIEQAIDRH